MPILSKTSLRNLSNVNPKLQLLCIEAIKETPVDFRVTEGLRTLSRQKHLLAIGASQTLNSKHLTGDAVDLVPWDGGPRWEWPLIYRLAEHIRKVALKHAISLRWGGVWDMGQSFTYTTSPPEQLVIAYVARQKAKGKKAFLDGPHFELCQRSNK